LDVFGTRSSRHKLISPADVSTIPQPIDRWPFHQGLPGETGSSLEGKGCILVLANAKDVKGAIQKITHLDSFV